MRWEGHCGGQDSEEGKVVRRGGSEEGRTVRGREQ